MHSHFNVKVWVKRKASVAASIRSQGLTLTRALGMKVMMMAVAASPGH